jgi:hypothetical protein
MNKFFLPARHGAMLAIVLGLTLASPAVSPAQSAVKFTSFQYLLDLSTTPATFNIEGVATHLGRFMGKGQVALTPGEETGSLVGAGPVVLRAANGDLLVGNMTWTIDAPSADNKRATAIHFRWSDSVMFSDGTTVTNTGRFVTKRPPGGVAKSDAEVRSAILFFAVFGPIFVR